MKRILYLGLLLAIFSSLVQGIALAGNGKKASWQDSPEVKHKIKACQDSRDVDYQNYQTDLKSCDAVPGSDPQYCRTLLQQAAPGEIKQRYCKCVKSVTNNNHGASFSMSKCLGMAKPDP